MGVQLTSRSNKDYVYIKSIGEVNNIEEYKVAMDQYYDIMQKSNLKRSIINESELNLPNHKHFPIQIVDYQNKGLPFELRNWKIANITTKENLDILSIWETISQLRGFEFKLFVDEETARKWLLSS